VALTDSYVTRENRSTSVVPLDSKNINRILNIEIFNKWQNETNEKGVKGESKRGRDRSSGDEISRSCATVNGNNESTIINPPGDQCRLIFRFARNAVRLKSRREKKKKRGERERAGAYLDVSRVKARTTNVGRNPVGPRDRALPRAALLCRRAAAPRTQ